MSVIFKTCPLTWHVLGATVGDGVGDVTGTFFKSNRIPEHALVAWTLAQVVPKGFIPSSRGTLQRFA